MAGYTRQRTIADGNTIAADLFNGEYNALVSAFHVNTGHKHDGTAAEGPVIGLIGDAGLATPLNKIVVDTTNDHLEFYVDVSGTATQQFRIEDGAIVPITDNDIDLGTSSLPSILMSTSTCTSTGSQMLTLNKYSSLRLTTKLKDASLYLDCGIAAKSVPDQKAFIV